AQSVASVRTRTLADFRCGGALDTRADPWSISSGTYSSRFAAMGASATGLAARRLRDKLLRLAGHLLEAPVEDLEFGAGEVRVKGSPFRSVKVRRLAGLAHWNLDGLPGDLEAGLETSATFRFPGFGPPDGADRMNVAGTYGFMADIAVVDVDPETAEVAVRR